MQSFLPAPLSSTHTRTSTAEGRFRTAGPAPSVNGTDDTVDAKAIDSLLNEIAVVLARWNLYIKFLAVKCQVNPRRTPRLISKVRGPTHRNTTIYSNSLAIE